MSQPLIDNLPLIAAAPDGIKALRGLILDLAVRGKLVPQDASDHSVTELVAGPRGQETPYTLPPSWEWVAIGEHLDLLNGMAFKPGDWLSSGLKIVRIQNLNRPDAPYNYCDPDSARERSLIDDGTLLISWSGTPGTSFGAFIWSGGPAVLNQHIFRCDLKTDAFDKQFLRLAVNGRLDEMIAKAHGGVGLQHITKGKLEAMAIPLPPLDEQRRIVAKFDELMALCDRLEAQQADAEAVHATLVKALLDTLTQSQEADDFAANWHRLSQHFPTIFTTEASLDALKQSIRQLALLGKIAPQSSDGELGRNITLRNHDSSDLIGHVCGVMETLSSGLPNMLSPGWQWVTLGDVINFGPQNGISPRPSTRADAPKAITLSATTRGVFDATFFKHVEADIPHESEYWLKPGDLLFQRGNSREYVGMAAYYEGEAGSFLYPDLMIKVRLSEVVDLRYVHLCAISPYGRDYFSTRASGTSESMPKINQGTLLAFPLPIPPLAEQRRIVAKVDELLALCDTLKAQIAESRKVQRLLAVALIDQTLAA